MNRVKKHDEWIRKNGPPPMLSQLAKVETQPDADLQCSSPIGLSATKAAKKILQKCCFPEVISGKHSARSLKSTPTTPRISYVGGRRKGPTSEKSGATLLETSTPILRHIDPTLLPTLEPKKSMVSTVMPTFPSRPKIDD